ncbi:MAG: hypothetical protein AAGE03_10815 [Pseudomonadota bacterium]
MSRAMGQTLGDLIGIGVAIWFLLDRTLPGADIRFLQGVALFVIGLSLWRIWHRWRQPR